MPRRALFAVLLLGILGVPLILPFFELASPQSWSAWSEGRRILHLAATTIGLCSLTLLFALPPGLVLAVLLFRTDLPARRLFQIVLGVCLFVPLPLFALGWQSVGGGGWRPWTQGIGFAALIHAAAALPWVTWLVGLGLRRVEPELEEDALTGLPAWQVLPRVSMRRCAPSIGLATVWVALQTAGEITVTDMAIVRTFAEEVYTQFVASSLDGLGRAVAIALPPTILAIAIVGGLIGRWAARLAVVVPARPPRIWELGSARWTLFAAVLVAILVYSIVPLGSLVRQAGGGENWTADRLALELRRAVALHWTMVLDSIAWAFAAGVLAAGLALVASIAAVDSRLFRRLLFVLAIGLWVVPGPVLGFGLKGTIEQLMDVEDALLAWTSARPIRLVLYELSTPAPVLWSHVLRLFPYAAAIAWPAVRDVPRDLRESARMDGAGAWGEFRCVVWPATRGAFWTATVAVSALALGELAASKLVQVPGRQTFAHELFNQMHYGATATTAALAIVQLLPAIAACFVLGRWLDPREGESIKRRESLKDQ
jgi:iron(III) transport system permease protein